MSFRTSDAPSKDFIRTLSRQQRNLNAVQERITTGRRINRPSDDPFGAAAVVRLRANEDVNAQFQSSAKAAGDFVTQSDIALDTQERTLDRIRTLVVQGISSVTPAQARTAVAQEIDSLRRVTLNAANGVASDGRFLFGGTRQDAPPFDPVTGAAAATPATPLTVQLEPSTPPVEIGVTAEGVFTDAQGTLFDLLAQTSAALRGTGDPAADQATLQAALGRLEGFADQTALARTRLGASTNEVDRVTERLTLFSETLAQSRNDVESADFAESAVELAETQRGLEATVQVFARSRRSLLDFLA
jgi:flagellar hook-associated protein 3 FlgL